MAGNQVQERVGGARSASLTCLLWDFRFRPRLSWAHCQGRRDRGRGPPPTPHALPSDFSQPGNHGLTLPGSAINKVRWLGGLNQDKPCSMGEG